MSDGLWKAHSQLEWGEEHPSPECCCTCVYVHQQGSEHDGVCSVGDVFSNDVLVNCSVEVLQKLIFSGQALEGFLPVECEKRGGSVDYSEEVECNEVRCMGSRSSDLAVVEDSTEPKKCWRRCDEKEKILHHGMQIILDWPYNYKYEGFGQNASSDSCWRLCPAMIPY